ncbi:MAG: hypothetical protein Q8N16_02490 [bacterium]|nr:hypothetical protein [bacterium]
MKNTKTKFILSAIIFLSIAGFVGIVVAASSSLYVSPASLTKTAGDTFSVSVGVDASGSKVCAVEGTLVFNNLTCQSITVASDVTPQSLPTCSNPYFLLGVPSCTTANKVLFTVSARAGNAGTASISFTGVDIIGEGVSVGSVSTSGNYTINAVSTPMLTSTPTPTPTSTPASVLTLKPTPTPTSISTPTPEITTSETEQQPTEIPAEVPAVESPNLFLAAVSSFITLGTGNNIIGIIVILAIGLIIYLAYSYFAKKKK